MFNVIVPPTGIVVKGVKTMTTVLPVASATVELRETDVNVAFDASSGTKAPTLPPSVEVRIVKPVLLLATLGPAVNSQAAKIIFEAPTGKSAEAVVHTMVSVPAVNAQVDVRAALPDTGTRVPAGADLALK